MNLLQYDTTPMLIGCSIRTKLRQCFFNDAMVLAKFTEALKQRTNLPIVNVISSNYDLAEISLTISLSYEIDYITLKQVLLAALYSFISRHRSKIKTILTDNEILYLVSHKTNFIADILIYGTNAKILF